jgi:hypothetical protein
MNLLREFFGRPLDQASRTKPGCAVKDLSKADLLVYFTGSPKQQSKPSALQDLEKIELFKGLDGHVPEERRRELVALIERMCELPSYSFAKEVARDFGNTGFFSVTKFTRNMILLAGEGFLINPVSGVFGLSPNTLLRLDFLNEFLGRSDSCSAEEIWGWVRKEIRAVERAQRDLKALGVKFPK